MFNYVVFINKKKEVIVLDYECDAKYRPEVGYVACPYWDWDTDNKDLQEDNDVKFDIDKAFDGPGVYKVYGEDTSCDTPDGYYEGYKVFRVEKIEAVNY